MKPEHSRRPTETLPEWLFRVLPDLCPLCKPVEKPDKPHKA